MNELTPAAIALRNVNMVARHALNMITIRPALSVWKNLGEEKNLAAVKAYESIPEDRKLSRSVSLYLLMNYAKSYHSEGRPGAGKARTLLEGVMDSAHLKSKRLEAHLFLLDLAVNRGFEDRKEIERGLFSRMAEWPVPFLAQFLDRMESIESGFLTYSSYSYTSTIGNIYRMNMALCNFKGDIELRKLRSFSETHLSSDKWTLGSMFERFAILRMQLAAELNEEISHSARNSFDHILRNRTDDAEGALRDNLPKRLPKIYSLIWEKVDSSRWSTTMDSVSASLAKRDEVDMDFFLYSLEGALERKANGSAAGALEISFISALGKNMEFSFLDFGGRSLAEVAAEIAKDSRIYSLEAKRDFFSGLFMNPQFHVSLLSPELTGAMIRVSNRYAKALDQLHGAACRRDNDLSDFMAKLDLEKAMRSSIRMFPVYMVDSAAFESALEEPLKGFLNRSGN